MGTSAHRDTIMKTLGDVLNDVPGDGHEAEIDFVESLTERAALACVWQRLGVTLHSVTVTANWPLAVLINGVEALPAPDLTIMDRLA